MAKAVFEIFEDKQGKYRFRLKASNGEIIAASQKYASKQNCKKGIDSVKKNAQEADVVEKEEEGLEIFERGVKQIDPLAAGLALLASAVAVAASIMAFM